MSELLPTGLPRKSEKSCPPNVPQRHFLRMEMLPLCVVTTAASTGARRSARAFTAIDASVVVFLRFGPSSRKRPAQPWDGEWATIAESTWIAASPLSLLLRLEISLMVTEVYSASAPVAHPSSGWGSLLSSD